MAEHPPDASLLWVQRGCIRDVEHNTQKVGICENSNNFLLGNNCSHCTAVLFWWSVVLDWYWLMMVSLRYSRKLQWHHRSTTVIRKVCLKTGMMIWTLWSSVNKRLSEEERNHIHIETTLQGYWTWAGQLCQFSLCDTSCGISVLKRS